MQSIVSHQAAGGIIHGFAVMIYSSKGADDIHAYRVMICQACGLDKKRSNFCLPKVTSFLAQRKGFDGVQSTPHAQAKAIAQPPKKSPQDSFFNGDCPHGFESLIIIATKKEHTRCSIFVAKERRKVV